MFIAVAEFSTVGPQGEEGAVMAANMVMPLYEVPGRVLQLGRSHRLKKAILLGLLRHPSRGTMTRAVEPHPDGAQVPLR